MTKFDKIYFKGLISQLQDEIAAAMKEKGFYDKLPNKAEMIALMHSELSECLEAIRNPVIEMSGGTNGAFEDVVKPKKDEHCPEFDNEIIELVDCIIRIFHYAGRFKLPLGEALFAKLDYNLTRPHKHGKAF